MTYPNQPQPGYYPPQYNVPQPPYNVPQPQYSAPAPGYPAPQPAPQVPVLARGTLGDYLDQPTMGGGAALTKFFSGRPQGSWLQYQVSRDLTDADVRQQTDSNGVPLTYKDGRPKFVLVVPVTVLNSSDGSHTGIFDGGAGSLWLKGVTSDAFKQAIAAAGIPNPDKAMAGGKLAGAVITQVSAGEKPAYQPGRSPTKLYNFTYQPNGRELSDAPVAAAPAPVAPAAPPAPSPVPPLPPTVLGTPALSPVPPLLPTAPVAPAAPQAYTPPAYEAPAYTPPAAPAAPPAPPAPPATPVDAARQELLNRLSGAQG